MRFFGFIKCSLVDYPGNICATVFTGGCNMNCTYCHNPELICPKKDMQSYTEEHILSFLLTRKGKLDGVCITGGEPTLHKDLLQFMADVKRLGFLVKLDTNGTNPDFLQQAFSQKIVDFVAMDVKAPFEAYERLTQVSPLLLNKIKLSMKLIEQSGVAFEYRTTVVNGFHTKEMLYGMRDVVRPSKPFFLQKCRQQFAQDEALRSFSDFSDIEMKEFAHILQAQVR